jgi:hypothetical protein
VADDPSKSIDDVDWRDQVSTVLKFERVAEMVDAAFEDMEP